MPESHRVDKKLDVWGKAVWGEPMERYRYLLDRVWDPEGKAIGFICLNPSTATDVEDDPTIRRVQGFARSWGYGRVIIGNLFALRSTDPKELYRMHAKGVDVVGEFNDHWLLQITKECDEVVLGWGNHGTFTGRSARLLQRLQSEGEAKLSCLGLTGTSQPKHPLYLASKTERRTLFRPLSRPKKVVEA